MNHSNGQNADFLLRLKDSFIRHRWLFVLSVVSVIGVTVIALSVRKTTYKASAKTQVVSDTQQVVSALGEQYRYTGENSAQQNVDHFYDLLGDDRPDGFVDTVLKMARLDKPIDVDPRAADPRYALLKKRLFANADSDTLFTISLTWENAQECERIVTAFQQQYIEEMGLDRQAKSIATTKFLDSEIKNYEVRLRKAEQAVIDYKKNNSGELPESQAADIQQLTVLKTQRDTLLVSSQDSTLQKLALEQHISQIKPMSIAAQTFTDGPSMMALRGLQSRRAQAIASGYTPGSDLVSGIDGQIAIMTAQAEQEIKHTPTQGKVITKTDMENNPEYEDLDQQLTAAEIAEKTQIAELKLLDQQIAAYEVRIDKIPAAQRELTDKTRDSTIFKERYEKLLENREEAEEKASLDKLTARSTLLEVGTVYAEASTPRSKLMIMLAASVVVGLFVGAVVVLLSEWSDQTIRYGSDAERILGLPLLTEVAESAGLSPFSRSVPEKRRL